jgi:DNA-binding GntR family transcriptional regulator
MGGGVIESMKKMATSIVVRKSKKGSEVDRVYDLLKSWILECRFHPGDFLPEVEVAKQCKTSRTPVREACNRLVEEKWVSKIQNKGYLVTPIFIQDVIEVYQYRKLLECFTAERTAQVIRPKEITSLKELLSVEGKANAKITEVIQVNNVFHLSLGRLARNQRVFDQLQLTLEYVHRLDIPSTQRDAEWVAHRPILAAIEAHDPKAANAAMAQHIDDSRDRMLNIFFSGELSGIRQMPTLSPDDGLLAQT